MNQHEQLLNLCASFYEAALDPSAWSEVLTRVADSLGAVGADLHLLDGDDLRCNYTGVQPATAPEEQSASCRQRESHAPSLRHLPAGEVITLQQFVDAQGRRHRAGYGELASRADRGHRIAAAPLNDNQQRAYFGLHLPPAMGAPSSELLALVKAMQPHLGRAVSAQFRMMNAELRNHVYADALDRLSCGMVILNRAGKLMLCNAVAQSVFDEGHVLQLTQGHLSANITAESRKLKILLQRALTRPGPRGGALILHGAGQHALSMTIDAADETFCQRTGGAVHVYITDLTARPCRVNEQRVREMFGFTPAETRVAAGVADGEQLRALAARIGVTYASARFTLKRVYEKLGVHKQGELVALVHAALPPLRVAGVARP